MRRHWQVLVAAWRERRSSAQGSWHAQGVAFLPAALEVQESPPSPMGRAMMWTVMALFVLVLGWASMGNVDIVAVATGRLVPPGMTKVIQPLEAGIVRRIHVRDGQSVAVGDPLIDLDARVLAVEQAQGLSELRSVRTALSRVEALRQSLADPHDTQPPVLVPPSGAEHEDIVAQRRMMMTQWEEYRARARALRAQVNRQEAERAVLVEEIKRRKSILPLVERRVNAIRSLMEDKLAAEQEYLSTEQERIEHVRGLSAAGQRIVETGEAIEQALARRAALDAEFRKALSQEGLELKGRQEALVQSLEKLKIQLAQRQLRSPVDGTVQQLAVHTLGAVVTPAQPLMVIVPGDSTLEVEAVIQNRDIGFIRTGQAVEVKVDAFPFTHYGTIPGEIEDISRDVAEASETGTAYRCRVSLARSTIQAEGRWVQLAPGMSVSVEIKTGRRRLIEYFLSPLLRYAQESVRER